MGALGVLTDRVRTLEDHINRHANTSLGGLPQSIGAGTLRLDQPSDGNATTVVSHDRHNLDPTHRSVVIDGSLPKNVTLVLEGAAGSKGLGPNFNTGAPELGPTRTLERPEYEYLDLPPAATPYVVILANVPPLSNPMSKYESWQELRNKSLHWLGEKNRS